MAEEATVINSGRAGVGKSERRRITTGRERSMTTQSRANNRSRRANGAASLETSSYFEAAAPVPKPTEDREKRAAGRAKKKSRKTRNPRPSPTVRRVSSAREPPTIPTERHRPHLHLARHRHLRPYLPAEASAGRPPGQGGALGQGNPAAMLLPGGRHQGLRLC